MSPAPATVEIAHPNDALTFARAGTSVLAVTRYADGIVRGVDAATLTARPVHDPIPLVEALGYAALRDAILAAPSGAAIDVPAHQLGTPLDLRDAHVAVGTNYPEHAGEASVQDGPFLFPKLVAPTGPRAEVNAGDALLDYEVELAWVTLAPLAVGETPAGMGVILCNDYTDRATLLRHVDVRDVTSGAGFTTGKSAPGYLPVGDLFVVPRDFRAFAATRTLRLWVNDALRQESPVSRQLWDVDAILSETWARRSTTWAHRGTRVALPGAGGVLPERTLLMSGTPAGTVFRGIGLGTKLAGVGAWARGGWATPVTRHVIEAYVREARAARTYLQPGDGVAIQVPGLGSIHNTIVP